MSFPKNKRRKMVIDNYTYEWCFSNGTLYYKYELDKSVKSVSLSHLNKITPNVVKEAIQLNLGVVASPQQIVLNKESFEKKKLEDRAKYKLYIWTGVLTDWTSGMMFAYAKNLKEARDQVRKSMFPIAQNEEAELMREPNHIINGKPKGFHIYGGS